MYCESCGAEAETRHVAFYQNIGALIVRFTGSAEGNFCKSCIHRYFWSMTATCLFLGWWGIISFIINPFFILNNVVRYLCCLGMKAPDRAAVRDEDDDYPPTRWKDAAEECYLCGRTLLPEERESRVCRACS
jgi:hypothetical protein